MQPMLQSGKRILSVAIAAATIALSVGLAGIVRPATALGADAGDLIKGSLSTVYYYGFDGMRYTFPNEKTYFTWYSNFNDVMTISDSALADITLGGNVVYRPGAYWVKIQSDPKVYAVSTEGMIHWIESETVASDFAGSDWASRIQDVPDAFFVDYTVGASLMTAAIYDGALYSDGGYTYLAWDGAMRLVTDDGMSANGFMSKFVLDGANIDDSALSAGSDLSAEESALTDTAQNGGDTSVPDAGSLSVALASDNPAGTTILADATNGGQSGINVMKLTFTGGDEDSEVTTLKLTRGGISADSDVQNAYLYDGDTRLADMSSLSSGVMTFTASGGLFTIPANGSKTVWISMWVDDDATSGKTINWALNAASDVTLSSGTLAGNFPLQGNSMTVAAVTDLAYAKLAAGTTATTVDPGTVGFEAMRFTVQAQNQDISLQHLNFTVLGSVSSTDVANISLWDGTTQLGSTVAGLETDKTVMIDLSSDPYEIINGVTKTLSVKADIVNGSSRTVQFSLQRVTDVGVMDEAYNVQVNPYTTVSGGTQTFATVSATSATINSGSITFSKNSSSPSGSVALNGTNIEIARYDVKAVGEDIKVNTLTFRVTLTTATNLKNLRLIYDGAQVGTTQSSVATATATAVSTNFTMPAGVTKTLSIYADIASASGAADALAANDTVQAQMDAGSSNAQGVSSLSSINMPGANTTGNSLTVATGSLAYTKNPAYGSLTRVKGASNQLISSFLLTAGSAEAVDVTQLVLASDTGTVDVASTSSLGAAFSALMVYDGSTQLGTTVTTSTADAVSKTYTFSLSTALRIEAGAKAQIDVYADILSGATWTNTEAVEADTATGTGVSTTTSVTTASDGDAAGQGITLATSGTVTLSVDGSTPANQQIVMSSTDNSLAVWKFEANNNEDLNVGQIVVGSTTSVGGDVNSLALYVDGVQIGATVPSLSAATNGSATFGTTSGTLFTVAKGGFKTVTLKATVTGQENATGASAITPKITTPSSITGISTDGIIVRGASSGAYATLANASTAYAGNSAYAYRTEITPAVNSASPSGTGKVRQSNDNVFKLDLTAASGYQAAFRAAGNNTLATTTTAWTGGSPFSSLAATSAVFNTGDDDGTLAANSTTPLVASTAFMRFTQGSTTPVAADGMTHTFAATDISAFNGIAVWIRASRASINLTMTLTGASAGSHTIDPTNNDQWQLFVVPFSGATTPFTGLTAVTAIKIVSASAYTASDTVDFANFFFYKDFLKVNMSGTGLVDATLVTAKDNDKGTTFAAGYFDGSAATATANTTGTVHFFPTSEFDIAASGKRTITLVTDTTVLLNAAADKLASNVNPGTASSTVASPGDILWYDGKVSTAVPWLDYSTVLQGGSMTY